MTDELFSLAVNKLINSMYEYASILFKRNGGSIFYKDIVMDALIKVWRHKEDIYESIISLKAYWMRAIKTKYIDNSISVSSRKKNNDKYCQFITYVELEENTIGNRYDEQLYKIELESIRSRLTPRQNELYKWRYKEELSNKDIAAKLNIPYNTAKTQIHDLNKVLLQYRKII